MNADNSGQLDNGQSVADPNSDSDLTSAEIQDSELEDVNGGFLDFKVEFQPGSINVDAQAKTNTTVTNKKLFGLF